MSRKFLTPTTSPDFYTGSGSPEGAVAAGPGAIYRRTSPTDSTDVIWVKVSGTSNTGWAQLNLPSAISVANDAYASAAYPGDHPTNWFNGGNLFDLLIEIATALSSKVGKSTYGANAILATGTTSGVPTSLPLSASNIVGRKATGNVAALTGAEVAAICAGEVFKQAQEINAQTGTTYTLVASDAGKLVTLSNASAITLSVPQDSAATIAIGTYVDLMQLGAGQVTVAAGSGATLRVSGLTAKARAQYSRMGVQKISANTFVVFGDLAAS